MDSLELDADAFYICTEVSPRNYVVQKAIQIDKSQIERMVGDLEKNAAAAATASNASGNSVSQPPPPPLPYWFTRECKEKLMKVELPSSGAMSSTSQIFVPSTTPQIPAIDLKQQLKNQLEYYFSRENLMTDRYLRCQMDNEQYVPITVIAGFRKIVQLTNDYDLIVQALRESNLVEVDEKGEKVRPITKRTTIILREVGQEHKDEVEKMLAGGPAYLDLKYGLNDSWYITYETEEQTQDAYVHLQGIEVMFNNRPICARIKAGGPPANLDQQLQSLSHTPEPSQDQAMFPPMMDLGHVLSAYGFIPVATYRPGTTLAQAEEEEARTPIATRHQPFRYSNSVSGGAGGQGQTQNTNPITNPNQKTTGKPNNPKQNNGIFQKNGNSNQQTNAKTHEDQSSTSTSSLNKASLNNSRQGESRSYPNNSWRKGERTFRRNNGQTSNSQNSPIVNVSSSSVSNPLNSSRYPPLHSNRQINDSSNQQPVWNNPNRDDLPAPPVWPAPKHSRAKKESEKNDSREEMDGNVTPTPADTTSSQSGTNESYAGNRKQSTQSTSGSSYSYEEQAFPCLPKPQVEPEKRIEKPTFSSVAAGKRNIKQIPETKKSYAEKLKERATQS